MHPAELWHWFETHPLAVKLVGGLFLIILPHIGSLFAMIKTRKQMEVTTATMQRLMASKMKDRAASLSPDRYFTLDLKFKTGQQLKVPMFIGEPVEVAENITIAVSAHTKERTIATLQCHGIGVIPSHRHEPNMEILEVKEGTVTHLETGRIYTAGESWEIAAGEFHSAMFHDAVVIITYRPPLHTAKEQPMNLDAIHMVQVA